MINSISSLERSGIVIANDFINDLDRYHITDDGALYNLVDGLTLQSCHSDDVKLKALLNRIQKQLELQR